MMNFNHIKLNKRFLDLLLGFGSLLLLAGACSSDTSSAGAPSPASITDSSGYRYFSLENYFKAEIERLSGLNSPVRKTVSINGETESQTLHITNWNHELDLFLGADINKAAWRNSYAIDSLENAIVYESLEPDLKTKKITIEKGLEGEIASIEIENEVSNWIYRSKELLIYVPDSVYEIKKQQVIRIVGNNEYQIKVFGKP